MSPGVEVSVVLPAYNEAETIERTVSVTLERLATFLPAGGYEVLVAEDGCADRTPELAARMAEEDEHVRHVHSDERLGRGGALEAAFERANGDTLVYFDTDLATDMKHLEELVESVRAGEYDLATGSRWLPENRADRPPKRAVSSLGYNTLVRLFLRSDLQDHQCGFKAFDREAFDVLRDEVADEHWFWDTEMLVRAQRHGFRVKEFPVEWEPKGDTKVDLVRDVFGMGSQILRTWWQLSVSPRITQRVSATGGTLLVVVALALMTVYLDPQRVLEEMRGADPELVVLSGLVYLLSWPVRGMRYRDILAEIGFHERVGFLTGAIFISQTGNLVFPARLGDGVRAYVVKARRGIPYASGFASLAVERVFDLLTITLLAGTVLLGLVATGNAADLQAGITTAAGIDAEHAQSGQTALAVAAGVGLTAIVAVAVIVLSARTERNDVRRAVRRLSSDSYADYVATVLERFAGDVQTVAGDGRSFTRVGVNSLAIWTLDVATALVVLAAFGVHNVVSLPLLVAVGFFAVSVGNLAKVLPLSPGGIGLYEGAFTLLTVAIAPGIGAATAFAVSIVDHFVKNVATVLGGVVSMAWLNVSLTEAVEESREAETADVDGATPD
jgi:uncharacterized protein (TIRG00374 family)